MGEKEPTVDYLQFSGSRGTLDQRLDTLGAYREKAQLAGDDLAVMELRDEMRTETYKASLPKPH